MTYHHERIERIPCRHTIVQRVETSRRCRCQHCNDASTRCELGCGAFCCATFCFTFCFWRRLFVSLPFSLGLTSFHISQGACWDLHAHHMHHMPTAADFPWCRCLPLIRICGAILSALFSLTLLHRIRHQSFRRPHISFTVQNMPRCRNKPVQTPPRTVTCSARGEG